MNELRSARRPSGRLERTLVLVLAGFIAVDLLLIVPAFASELRLDRLHPSLPIVDLRPLAAGRARIANGLREEFTAPVRALAAEMERAGTKAFNSIWYEEDTASGSPSGPTKTQTTQNDQENGESALPLAPSASPGSIETSVMQTATSLAMPTKTKIPTSTPTQIPSYTPTSSVVPTEQSPTMTPSQAAVVTATVVCTALPTTACQSTPYPTSTPIPTSTSQPTNTHTATPTLPQEGRQTYYVATNGNDSNPGTEAQPFRTINRGVSVLGPGDTLIVKSGTYAESLWDVIPSGTSWANPVTLAAYPGEVVTIKPNSADTCCSGLKVIRFARSQYIVVDGFILDGENVEEEVIKITSEAHHIRIQNSEVKGAPRQGILVTTVGSINSDYNEFINLDVHDNGTTDFDHGLYISTSHNLIDRSSIHDNAGWGVHIYSQGCSDCANDNVVINNAIYDNARVGDRGPGIALNSGSGNLVYNNLIWGNYSGIQVAYGVSDSHVYNNVVYANDNYGIRIQSDSVNAIIRNNIVYQNGGETISDAGSGTVQDHNLVETDPRFVDPAAHDFHLQPSSPAIDTGVALSPVPDDFDGVSRPRGAGFDIGAYESLFN